MVDKSLFTQKFCGQTDFSSQKSGQSCKKVEHACPTGQNYSLELTLAKFATAKNREKLVLLTFSSSGA